MVTTPPLRRYYSLDCWERGCGMNKRVAGHAYLCRKLDRKIGEGKGLGVIMGS